MIYSSVLKFLRSLKTPSMVMDLGSVTSATVWDKFLAYLKFVQVKKGVRIKISPVVQTGPTSSGQKDIFRALGLFKF